ncbi:DUF6886 family protein [Metabacillus idriensis]|uniref:DUF6886 family protein n=1 Tax=Metabacillus idriensis TaxID=324768 RepID=UPI001748E970|nr:DUF6886 family protein [Metabacillus idriensis]
MLFHFSEDPSIQVFKPRLSASFPNRAPAVWAIDQEHSLHYYFPRDCPRVIYWKGESTNAGDIERFFSDSNTDKIIVIENSWLERMCSTKLYVYTLPEESIDWFEESETAGYYVSHQEIVPLKVELVGNLMEKIIKENVELRFTPNLLPIRNRVLSSTLDFSIIRFRNAVT